MADNIDVFLKKNILSHGSGHGQRLSGRKHNPIENLGSQSRQSKVMELLSVSGIDNSDLNNRRLMVVQDENDIKGVDVTGILRNSPDARIEDIIAKAANIRPEFFKLPPMYLIYEYEIEQNGGKIYKKKKSKHKHKKKSKRRTNKSKRRTNKYKSKRR